MAVNDTLQMHDLAAAIADERLPDGYTVRPATPGDIQAAVDLINACYIAETGSPVVTVEEMQTEWDSPGFDLETDAICVFTPNGVLAGYSEYWNVQEPKVRPYLFSRTHPDHTGQGIGTGLLHVGFTRAEADLDLTPANARFVLRSGTNTVNQAARQLLENEGFDVLRYFWHMGIEMDAAPPTPQWPEGITIRSLPPTPTDDKYRRVFEATEEAFQDHWGHLPIAFEQWLHWVTSNPDHDPTLFFMAMDGDEIAGVSLCQPKTTEDPNRGWVDDLGVRRPWRRQGIALALLLHTFGEFWRRGTRKVGLAVDAASLTGATRLYEKAGMHKTRELVQYGLVLRDGEELSTEDVV